MRPPLSVMALRQTLQFLARPRPIPGLVGSTGYPWCHISQNNIVRTMCSTKKNEAPTGEEAPLERPNSMEKSKKVMRGSDPTRGKGPVSWKSLLVTGGVAAVLYSIYYYLKEDINSRRREGKQRNIGKADIGGDFELIDQDGKTVTNKDLLGKWVFLYFGFTHCPDICPDEIEKMVEVVDLVRDANKSKRYGSADIQPVFISVDPTRDGVKEVREYVREFHPDLMGLTGSEEKVLQCCKNYRVYFSAGPKDQDEDYIVDHTIIIYLMNPRGEFVDYYGQTMKSQGLLAAVLANMMKYQA